MADWDERYRNPENLKFDPEPLLVEVAEQLSPGRALDLASGPGRNALYLARLGWQVTAVDSSQVAIDILRNRARGAVDVRLADLEKGEFAIEAGEWDLICDFFYLQRDLFGQIRAGVRLGGVFAGAIHLAGDKSPHRYVLSSGELRSLFAGWQILYYSEGRQDGHRRLAAQIVARRA